MSRKHFKSLAAALALSRPMAHPGTVEEHQRVEDWRTTVRNVADACSLHNDNFDRSRFLDAADYPD